MTGPAMRDPETHGPVLTRRPALHPEAQSEWFKALPHERRARMNREWREGLVRDRCLQQGERRRLARGSFEMALLFALANGFCPGDALWTYSAAFAVGGAVGLGLEALRAARLLSAMLGLAGFFLFQWLSRGGLSALHLFVLLPVGAISAYLGMRREE